MLEMVMNAERLKCIAENDGQLWLQTVGSLKEMIEKGKIYISGPITNIENWQKNFIAAEEALCSWAKAIAVVNPYRIAMRLEKEYRKNERFPDYTDYMREDIKALSECDAICLLPGWKRSKGARMEYRIAKILCMDIFYYTADGKITGKE